MDTSNLPTTIPSIYQPDYSSTTLQIRPTPLPLPSPNTTTEHLIKVAATSPCAGELLWAKNFPSAVLHPGKDAVVCYDLSGTVVTAPPDSPFPPGTPVYARTPAFRTGAARAYTLALTSELAVRPRNISAEEAAAVPMSATTAYQALFEHGGIEKGWGGEEGEGEAGRRANAGKRVLVTAAAGGVGVWAVQLARAAGVGEVVAVVGTGNVDFVRGLGAGEVVDYRKQSVGQWAAGREESGKADLVIDMVGGKTLEECWRAVKKGGVLLSVNEPPQMRRPEGVSDDDGITASFFIMEPRGSELSEVTALIEKGEVKPVVDSVWEFGQFEEAFQKLAGGHARGKIIIKVDE